MAAEHQEHRELTLMFSDIVGYSRLMGRDEALTIEMLGDYRKILLAHIAEHNGVFIEFAGDAIFARFDTARSAVDAAVAIQKHLQLFNQGREKDLPKLQTRIGIHKGDVLLRGNAVLGDDVNIAARLEPLAVADGICISKAIYDEIRTELREPIKPLGIQSLKNIQHKIRAYLIKPTGLTWRDHFHYFWLGCSKKIHHYRYPISAVVIAIFIAGFYFIPRWLVPGYAANYVEIANFQNLMNADGKSDYFSSGITEAVRSQLADMRDVYIVEADKGIHAPIRLEGSVQKIGDNLRIVYRIFRRDGNVQIAGGKLDGAYHDIFILQDRLVGDIARNLASEFKLQNFRPAPLKLTNDITAYDYYLQGMDFLNKPSAQENFDIAIQRFNEALVHDPSFALANTGLCGAYWKKYELVKSARWLSDAENYCLLSIQQNGQSAITHKTLGAIYRDTGQYSKAIDYLKQGMSIDKYNASIPLVLASVYDLVKNKKDAEKLYVETINTYKKNWETYNGYAYFLTKNGRYDEAIENYKKVLTLIPKYSSAFNNIGINYFYKDDFTSAATAFSESVRLDPVSSVFMNTGNMYYCSNNFKKAAEMFEEALRIEPENCQGMVYLADAYKFIPSKKNLANEYFKRASESARREIEINSKIAKNYQCLATALAFFGEIENANEIMKNADNLDPESAETMYVHLRIAIIEHNDQKIRQYVKDLLETEYSVKLLLAEPDFAVLKEVRFKDLFISQK
ncbi:MAG: adenylate/guanylate cyclase domain-containing protein [Gammaproteobacteria bacterium]|nr:MAG: adenylate/guanylate cyclase domain-containing protein [Gammaproteobacteria bacterium]